MSGKLTLWRLVFPFLLMLLSAFTVSAEELPIVKLVEVKSVEFKKAFSFTANALAFKSVDVYPQVQNRIIKKMYVDVGDRVRRGGLLALLDDEYAEASYQAALANVEQAKASLEQARVAAENAEKTFLRYKELFEKSVVSKQNFDNAKAQYEQAVANLKLAQAKLRSAEASLREAKITLDYHKVVSPIDGVVVKRFMDEGAMALSSTPLIRIIQDDPIKVQGALPQEALPYVGIGNEVEIYSDVYPDKVFKGKLKIVSPIVDPSTRTFSIEAWVDNPNYLLKAGMFLKAKLIAGNRKVLAIPLDCVIALNQVFVYSEGKIFERKITLGENQDSYVEVLEGLKEGEKVVFQPTAWLKNGMKVKVVE